MAGTPKSNRPHIAILGRRNVGKSSLINAITSQNLSIVSDTPGTTTDPVEKAMELIPFGPVVFIDTAGLDDDGELGRLRTKRSREVLQKTDIAIVVVAGAVGATERGLMEKLDAREIPFLLVFNKSDAESFSVKNCREWQGVPVSAKTGRGVDELNTRLLDMLKGWAKTAPLSLMAGLIPSGGLVVLVVPIDTEAPAGRLILPQVQVIRDILDTDALCMVMKERELRHGLQLLGRKPDIVITDSQAFLKVAGDVPDEVPMTSFSILFARQKGDLIQLAAGARAIDRLQDGDTVLISEACTHHTVGDDIGTVKIPRLLRQFTGKNLHFVHARGKYFEMEDDVALVIHCGGCMLTRRAMVSRIDMSRGQQVPMTNYGMAIAFTLGIFERALRPFGLN
ncbi:MAG: [FeFe] hydrogenase H-cluster maturation GTPase HydF [Acidobacteria bacterium]|nr:MAG: [FeFe] hydrogenase H-cluster maturation GTPase HydF [Acidobacteriota bacterium]RLE24737.1 MAG: [FeFe] hydrogenase H-cluster maturation GTPase HydF [Acidobacteriota bacterium]